MTMESEALKEINELKTEIAKYRNRLGVAQTIRRSNIALLRSIVQEFADSSFSCELIVASRLNSLELEK